MHRLSRYDGFLGVGYPQVLVPSSDDTDHTAAIIPPSPETPYYSRYVGNV